MTSPIPRILVIDDEEAVCELIVTVAESAGFDAISASVPAEINAALQGDFDLVVLDLTLGLVDGIEVMSLLGRRHRGLPVILVSGADQSLLESARRIAELHKLRVIGTFAKPFSLELLQAAMREWSEVSGTYDPTGPKVLVQADLLLDSEFLHLAYQPKVSTSTGEICGAEALVRWNHPEHGSVSPAVLVGIVERERRTHELLDKVMLMAARDRLQYDYLNTVPDISLNISVLDLDDEEMPRRALRYLSAAAPASAWTFEVTETAPITDVTPSLAILTRLRLAGFRLAVDDFGTGTSNIERLLVAPFSELKIDRTLVDRIRSAALEPDPLVRTSIEVGHSLNLTVIAEGVETVDQWRTVRDLGCDSAQGYFISQPIHPSQLRNAVDQWRQTYELIK
jgi:EAL domain-containing protein (putative c-di-GMP-specific phosphodiesterase class I)